jgi:hypothetical protein
MIMTDFNEIERQRWGGPSPAAGQDTRTDAQKTVIARVDAEARKIIEQSIYTGGRTNAEVADYTVRRLRERGLLDGGRPYATVPARKPGRAMMYQIIADGQYWIDSQGVMEWSRPEADALAELLERQGYTVSVVES